MPSDPVMTADSSLRMSPKRFSVSDNIVVARLIHQMHCHRVDILMLDGHPGNSGATSFTVARQSCETSSTLALSTLVSFLRRLRR